MEMKMPHRPRDIVIAVASIVLVGISLVFILLTFHRPHYSNAQYFTVDDGQTYFPLAGPHFAPFDYNGKAAVQVMLFKGSDGKPFVGYLTKYSDKVQQMLAKGAESTAPDDAPMANSILDSDRFFKRPGAGDWVSGDNPASAAIWSDVVDPKTGNKAPHWNGH